ncbi:toll/interleukin-1 receptor domain-containing protein [Pyxidicoccus parkwayensis]|uniref:Toll/interleukin-1 receptor domain-containing protein n=1 Tax=Pyxidicoccus parkwayensis TaxID=2813578 RepID=A0ABX7NWC8_9BACT|nr:toll/interleukin-1 receptor domain-containing protein [Pyxidicoccus parkwaysis]QSQ23237.1 toll/interleukin-1 receptor domain-containing protein [Pyxidicoccus parkwaysis]
MDWPVFISYARSTSREQAEALHRALGEEVAFLDTSGIELGQRFPGVLADALLGARVIVVFVDEAYFTRWYCLWELRTALTPFMALPPDASEADKSLSLASIVLALPPEGGASRALERLPPLLRSIQWPSSNQTERLAQWVRACLTGESLPLAARVERLGLLEQTRARLLQESALPPPRSLAGLRLHPLELPPSIGPSFVGREDDLWRIDFALTTSRTGEGSAAALSGALEAGGGFGKTRLALEYLHRLGPLRFPGGLFWVDADVNDERLEEQLHGILSALRKDVPPLAEFRKQQRDARHELARVLHETSSKEPILYVVDNVPEPSPGQSPRSLGTWCPARGKVALLVTSRVRLSLGAEGVQALPVATLAPEAAMALLTEQVDRASIAASEWALITEWVGHLPLALELLNRTMRAGAITGAELLEKARRVGPALELDRQMEALRAHLPEGQLRGVTEALSISYERLPQGAQNAARFLAQLSPAPIPMALLDAMKPLFTPQVRAFLTQRSFVTGATGGRVPMFGFMHRVLADFLRSRSSRPELELEMAVAVISTVMDPKASEHPEHWPVLDAFAPHAEWLFARSKEIARAEFAVSLGLGLGNLRARQGLVNATADVRNSVARRAGESLGGEHRATLAAKNDLGDALRRQGNLPGARRLLEETLDIQRRVHGEEHPETLTVMNNYSLVLADLGEPTARPLAEHVLNARLRLLGEEHPETVTSMANLATIHFDQGELQKALTLHERTLRIRLRTVGKEHPETLLSMGNVASTLRRMGDLSAARSMQEELLKISWRLLGKEHPESLNTMNNLAVTLFARSDFAGARRLQEEALAIFQRTLGQAHPETLNVKMNLAYTLRKQGDLIGSYAMYEEVLDLRRQKLGELHPATLDSWSACFHALWEEEDFRRVRVLQERGLRIMENAARSRSAPIVTMAWRLFLACDYLDDIAAAQSVLNQHLLWLLDCSPESLDADLRKTREQVAQCLATRGTPHHRE